LRQDGDILRQFEKAVDPEVATKRSSPATILRCADNGLGAAKSQCFYLALLFRLHGRIQLAVNRIELNYPQKHPWQSCNLQEPSDARRVRLNHDMPIAHVQISNCCDMSALKTVDNLCRHDVELSSSVLEG
jgi:hypothetical protein